MRGRADRILDAAGALLLRHGYRKLTIGDIAEKAGIGKGTVYLHWRAKHELFEALLMRESIALFDEVLAELRADPAGIAPHRIFPRVFELTSRRPLVAALVTGDTDLLGQLTEGNLRSYKQLANERGFEVLVRYGLLRGDLPSVQYALQATITGFYFYDSLDPVTGARLSLTQKSEMLSHTIRHAFECAEPGRLEPAAAEFVELMAELTENYRKSIYSSDPGTG
ncbi:TetR/AcrR family transcriptional regulator [Amycolatopsis sp. 195334CR]|uniref:TetR/AcrR family transcriptional regulator n=1 Tax=Amycolatopsis sp. 195334CR TaxID=2814588 RepID=UPI001A905B59|nr:helix-turn-helix domain-containing protein [Amycolatopsis sp. 195334CR]MBN6041853.1 helix-turn-helix transcriptional regulator [Amycolatopsis sp. 195334CR]